MPAQFRFYDPPELITPKATQLLRGSEMTRWAKTGSKRYLRFALGRRRPHELRASRFIASSVYDNKLFLEKDHAYLANLKAQKALYHLS